MHAHPRADVYKHAITFRPFDSVYLCLMPYRQCRHSLLQLDLCLPCQEPVSLLELIGAARINISACAVLDRVSVYQAGVMIPEQAHE